jgi:hypothetical protein
MISRRILLISFAILSGALSARAEGYTYVYYYYRQPVNLYQSEAYDDNQPVPGVIRGGRQPIVSGSRAYVRHGVAYAPANAPDSVKQAIWAANALRGKPYKWGGGHGSFYDSGYDCSGTVCYALHSAGVLGTPIPSSDLLNYGQRGRGRWITVYSRNGHTFAVIAGLRLDTTGNCGTEGPRWHADIRDTGGYEARHPVGL